MKKGCRVEIIPSTELNDLKLSDLIGGKGRISEVVQSVLNPATGCWVKFDKPYENESEWYIPIISIKLIN